MTDSKQIAANPLAQRANPQRVSPDGTGQPVPLGDREVAGGESTCPLWDGHIIDAVFPLV